MPFFRLPLLGLHLSQHLSLYLGLWVLLLFPSLPCAAGGPPESRARVHQAVTQQVLRGRPVDVLLVMDDALAQKQLRSAVGPLRLDATLSRQQQARVRETRRQLLGQLKREENLHYKSPVEIALMRAIKQALDPQGLLNPGKVLPDHPTAAAR